MTLLDTKQDINDFIEKWNKLIPNGPTNKTKFWIQRCREEGYPEFRMRNPPLGDIIEWQKTTVPHFKFLMLSPWLGYNHYFFFNTEQDKVLFILRWS